MSTEKRYFVPGGDSSCKVKTNSRAAQSRSSSKFPKKVDSEKTLLGDTSIKSDSQDDTEALLEQLVFGGQDGFVQHLKAADVVKDGRKSNPASNQKNKRAAWHDDDDDDTITARTKPGGGALPQQQLEDKLRDKYMKIAGDPRWAVSGEAEGEDEGPASGSLLQTHTGNYTTRRTSRLAATTLAVSRCRDANRALPSDTRVTSVEFHPRAHVLATAGYNHRLSLFQVDGKENAKIESIFFEKFPIASARMINNADEIILGSTMAKHYYVYDLMSGKVSKIPKIMHIAERSDHMGTFCSGGSLVAFHGKSGAIHLVSSKTKQYVNSLRMPTDITCSTFSTQDDNHLYVAGGGGIVYLWDVRQMRCVRRMYDEGCVEVTSMALSAQDTYLAVGSASGVVNVYESSSIWRRPAGEEGGAVAAPKPLKAIPNLTTAVTHLSFNPGGSDGGGGGGGESELLAALSAHREQAVKMVHVPTLTVFANFPTAAPNHRSGTSGVGYPLIQHFSPHSGYTALTNYTGRVLLYRLHHYSHY